MLPKQLPVLLAFVGGCLSTAALAVGWRADAVVVDRIVEDGAPTSAAPDDAITGDGTATLEVEPHREPAAAHAVESVEPGASPKENDDPTSLSATESGLSVADVLARLEAAYRQKLAAAERVTPPVEVTTAAAPAPPSEVPAPETAIAVAVAAPIVEVRPEAPSANVHVGNVQQDTYNGDVHQGDVNQVQQVALFQTVQLLMLPPNGRVAPSSRPQRAKTRRMPHAHIAITDPNNPWGFDFPPTPLVK